MILDVSPVSGGIAGVGFLLVCLAAAFIVFKLLRRTMKMAFRIVIVSVIVAIAVAGSAFFLMLGSSKTARLPARIQSR